MPCSYRIIRRAAFRYALRRFLVLAVEAVQPAAAAAICDGQSSSTSASGVKGWKKSITSVKSAQSLSSKQPPSRARLHKREWSDKKATVDDAVAAMALRQSALEAGGKPFGASEASAMAFGGVNVSLYSTDLRARAAQGVADVDAIKEQIDARFAQQDGRIEALHATVDAKLDALTAAVARMGHTRPRQGVKARTVYDLRATTSVASSAASSPDGITGNGKVPPTREQSAARAAEREEMNAADGEGSIGGQTSSPFDA